MAYVEAYGIGSIAFAAYAKGVVLVYVSSVECVSSTKIRATFNREMTKNSALTSKYNYIISTTTPGAVTPVISSVVAENVDNPTYVELNTSEMTNDATYLVEVSVAGPVDVDGCTVDPDNNNGQITGIGVSPTVESVAAISENRVDVVFSENMTDNVPIRDASNYAFDNGLVVISILDVSQNTVKLVTSDQTPGLLYTLTVQLN